MTNASPDPMIVGAALRYARAGFRVEPMWRGKQITPCRRGYLNLATADLEAVAAAFLHFPGARNLGVVMGECGAGNVFIIDVDVGHADGANGIASAQRLFTELGGRQPGPIVRTPRGGFHIWMAAPLGFAVANLSGPRALAPGVDVRGGGSIVPAPPSVRSDGAYRTIVGLEEAALPMAPDALLQRIERGAPPRPRLPRLIPRANSEPDPWAWSALTDAVDQLADQQKPGRSRRLFHLAARLGGFVAAGRLGEREVRRALLEASRANGLVAENGAADVERTISNGLERGFAEPRPVSNRKCNHGVRR